MIDEMLRNAICRILYRVHPAPLRVETLESECEIALGRVLTREEFQQVDSVLFAMQIDEVNQEEEASVDAAVDEALAALNAQQTAWLEEHPWAEAAMTRAEQRREERARKKEEN